MKIKIARRGRIPAAASEECFLSRFFRERAHQVSGSYPILECEPKTVILREGQTPRIIYFIESGLVKLSQVQPTGAVIAAGIRGKHWLLGAAAYLSGANYGFTATALTPCTIRLIRTEDLEALIRGNGEFARHLCAMLSGDIKRNLTRVVELSAMQGRERLQSLLAQMVREVHRCGVYDGKVIYFPLKQYELAQLVCVTPEHLCRVMNDMEQDGVIARDRGTLIILDPDRLFESLHRWFPHLPQHTGHGHPSISVMPSARNLRSL